MTLSALPRRPTSVRLSVSSTRWLRSPAAISPAVSAIFWSGRKLSRMMSQAAAARAIRTAPLTRTSRASKRCSAASVPVSGIASASTLPLVKLASSTR